MNETQMQDQRAASEDVRGAELRLLTGLLGSLDDTTVIDVGAGRGGSVRAFVEAGASAVYAFEPSPKGVKTLRSDFAESPAVTVFDVALGERDGCGTAERRSLASLVSEGAVPRKVGILRVGAAGRELAVLKGMGPLASEVATIGYGDGAAETVGSSADSAAAGPAAFDPQDVASFMADRGYTNFVVVNRRDRFETLHINDAEIRAGDWGSVVFIHDAAFPRLAAAVYAEVAAAQRRLVEEAEGLACAAERRPDVVADTRKRQLDETRQAEVADATVESRRKVLEEQEQALEAYLRLSSDGRMWRWVAPQLGVLYQHDPAPFHVPEHYLQVGPSPPPISIVTPTMNSEQFLPFTIESVLGQGYPNLQYIIQDDDSTDGTLQLVEEYGT